MRALAGVLALFSPHLAFAHGGNPAEARVTAPEELGTIADDRFLITWIDSDTAIPTGTATVNLFYTESMPPTFFLGAIPATLTGTPIATGIREVETDNELLWDTSAVPSGTYWIWSRVDEPPEPIPSPVYLSFSPAPLAVQHPGDPLGPSIRVTRPNTPIAFSDTEYELRWEAFAPNGPATIRLEAGTSLDGSDFMLLSEEVTTTSTGSFLWDTRELSEGDWTIRAVITDPVDSFTAYARYFLLITHFFPNRDAGVVDASQAAPDATVSRMDAMPEPVIEEEGCSCASVGRTPNGWPLLLLLAIRRRHSSRGHSAMTLLR